MTWDIILSFICLVMSGFVLFKDTSLSSLQVISFPMNRNNGVFQFMYAHLKLGQDIKL